MSPEARGLRVLVVEDETLVLMNLEDILGHEVAGPFMRLEQALQADLGGLGADVAILDVNLGGKPVFPLAERLQGLGVPLLFATGYGRAGLPEGWQDYIVLTKPYSIADVADALARLAPAPAG
jgi:DNA-binding response OmpR family regulator